MMEIGFSVDDGKVEVDSKHVTLGQDVGIVCGNRADDRSVAADYICQNQDKGSYPGIIIAPCVYFVYPDSDLYDGFDAIDSVR
ncbi:hypothetical protein [Paenibacillus filicis]|uniref:hypothetical protein n=1 Tax=Paenibacillus filicis TaxID=669464 RepID=UPI003BF9CFD5